MSRLALGGTFAALLGASALAAGHRPAGADRVRVVAQDVAAGRTGVWLLSQVFGVSGPPDGPVLSSRGARLERIDPGTGGTRARIDLPIASERLIEGWSGRLWVTGSRLVRIDPRTRRARYVGGACEDLVADGRSAIWTGSSCAGTLIRRSPTGRPIGAPVVLHGARILAIAVGADGLYVTRAGRPASVEHRDPRTGRLVRAARVGRSPDGLVLRGGSLWALSSASGTVARLDPVTLGRTASTLLPFRGAGGSHLTVGRGAAWVIDTYGGRLARIDLRTEHLRARRLMPVPETLPVAIAAGRRSMWVAVRSDGTRSALCRLSVAEGAARRCFVRSR